MTNGRRWSVSPSHGWYELSLPSSPSPAHRVQEMKLAQTEITLPAVTTGVNIKPKEQNIQKILEDAAASMSSSTPPSEETDPPEAQEPIQEPMVCLFSFS
jgi:hypothetical protein